MYKRTMYRIFKFIANLFHSDEYNTTKEKTLSKLNLKLTNSPQRQQTYIQFFAYRQLEYLETRKHFMCVVKNGKADFHTSPKTYITRMRRWFEN